MKKMFISGREYEVIVSDTFFKRLTGLMGKSEMKENHVMLIKPCSDIHTCFMKFPIDAVFTDGDYKVMGVIENIPPWKLGAGVKKAKQVVEMNAGLAGRLGIKAGTVLDIRD